MLLFDNCALNVESIRAITGTSFAILVEERNTTSITSSLVKFPQEDIVERSGCLCSNGIDYKASGIIIGL